MEKHWAEEKLAENRFSWLENIKELCNAGQLFHLAMNREADETLATEVTGNVKEI